MSNYAINRYVAESSYNIVTKSPLSSMPYQVL